jgi:hypothetical protein
MAVQALEEQRRLLMHYVNASRIMIDKFVAGCSCQVVRELPAKAEFIKPVISSSFNSRGQVD